MGLPIVAIIGRPNVGKSSLLNALAGERISIVEPTAGVTRDRISTIIARDDKYFELIDTGGYGIVDSDQLSDHIELQILQAIESANLVLFMVDIRDGLVPLDSKIAQLLHKHGPPTQRLVRRAGLDVIGVANKADSARMFTAAADFSSLGFGEFLCISAINNLNKAVLLDTIFDKLVHVETSKPAKPAMKLAIVGKRNVGKSTLLNAMVGSERVIVSETPGTTRDSVDVRFEKDGKTIIAIDTAGIKKKSKMTDSIEFYSYIRATQSIRRADVVLFLIDAAEPVSQVDKKLAGYIAQEYKSCIIIINKWDLTQGAPINDSKSKIENRKSKIGLTPPVTGDYEQYLTKLLPGLRYAPIAFTTATEAKNIQSVLDLATEIFKQTTRRISTAKLNKAFESIKAERLGTARGRPRIYYATQIAKNPITIVMFVNNPKLFDESYRRFIINRLRDLLPIDEVPIKLLARPNRALNKLRG